MNVITVNRLALYRLLMAFSQGKEAVLTLAEDILDPENPIAILVDEFNLALDNRHNAGNFKLVKK